MDIVAPVQGHSTGIKWMLVAGGFHERGGQDRANAALASYLARRGDVVKIVGHSIDPHFYGMSNVRCVVTPRVMNSTILSELMITPWAQYQSLSERPDRVRVVANGGNFATRDVNWVHFVHRAWQEYLSSIRAHLGFRERAASAIARHREAKAFRSAKILIANSETTKRDILRHYPIDEARIHVVWLGSDSSVVPVTTAERLSARAEFGVFADARVAVFVGALGKDDRKGFSTLLDCWIRFANTTDENPILLVAGQGDALEVWEQRVKRTGREGSVRFLGFRTDVHRILAAADLLISPARYEAYGLNVHEALSRGIPALVSRSAGVADRFPLSMDEMLIDDPTSSAELEEKLRMWISSGNRWPILASELGARLRAWTWDDMAEKMATLASECCR